MPTPANIRETSIAFGKKKQSALQTANVLADLWKLSKVNASLSAVEFVTESNKDDIGKGHEFETQSFPSHWNISGSIEKYASAEFAAWAFAYALGTAVKTGTTPHWIYTIVPLEPVTGGIELPSFSFLEAIRQAADPVIDRMAVGCVIEDLAYTLQSGPGRANHKIVVNFVGCGKLTEPSGITHPAITAETSLPGSSAAITINSVDYVTAKDFVSLELGWKNNLRLDSGHYPGSGTQSGASIMGRLEHGDRELTMKFVARFMHDSAELTKLLNQTAGTATISTQSDAENHLLITLHQAVFRSAVIGETDGVVTVAVECGPQYHATNGIISVVAETEVTDICQ